MSGALIVGEALAGVVVALMFAGGQALESYAQGRALREMTALLGRVPRQAQVYRGGVLVETAIDAIIPDDRILVRSGEVVPVDGVVATGTAVLDESALTGEALPVRRDAGEPVASGVANAGAAFDLTATQTAAHSTYAGIVRLVEGARHSKAPMARLANSWDTKLGGSLADAVSCNNVVKGFGAEAREDARLVKVITKWRDRTSRTWVRGTVNGTTQGAL
eukprot:gene61242-81639_t